MAGLTAGLLGCTLLGCAAAPPPNASVATDGAGPSLHLVLTALSPSNVGRPVIDADIESWPRSEGGPVLYASPRGADDDCTPNVTVTFRETPTADARYRVGDDVTLFIETQCGLDGEMRSWRAVAGTITVAMATDGYRVHISRAAMQPSGGENAGYGTFLADGMGTRLVLHAS